MNIKLLTCCLLLQYALQSRSRGESGIVEDMCYEIRRAKAFFFLRCRYYCNSFRCRSTGLLVLTHSSRPATSDSCMRRLLAMILAGTGAQWPCGIPPYIAALWSDAADHSRGGASGYIPVVYQGNSPPQDGRRLRPNPSGHDAGRHTHDHHVVSPLSSEVTMQGFSKQHVGQL